ncbi:unnamed protein product, partial [Staurois parvus]
SPGPRWRFPASTPGDRRGKLTGERPQGHAALYFSEQHRNTKQHVSIVKRHTARS